MESREFDPDQIQALRQMDPGQRLKVAAQLYWSAKSLKAAALRSFHPEWTEDQVQRRAREIFLCGAG